LWILATFVLAYFPDLFSGLKLSPGMDKIVHAGVYFILCWLVRRAFFRQETIPQLKKSSFLGAFIFSCVYGLLDEFRQNSLPGRSSDAYDLLAGAAGALLYVAAASVLSQRKNGGREEPES
jgi:VanZ family protein